MTCDEALFRARVRETAGPRYPSGDWDGATIGSPDLSSDAAQRANSGSSSDGPALVRADSSHATYPLACDGGQSCSSLRGLAAAQLDHEREAA